MREDYDRLSRPVPSGLTPLSASTGNENLRRPFDRGPNEPTVDM